MATSYIKTSYMKNSYIWIMSAAAIALSGATAAQADEPALSFALPPPDQGAPSQTISHAEIPNGEALNAFNTDVSGADVSGAEVSGAIAPAPPDQRLSIPVKAAKPPVQPESLAKAELPPPPPLLEVPPLPKTASLPDTAPLPETAPLPDTAPLPEANAVVTFAANPPSLPPTLATQAPTSVELALPPAAAPLPIGGETHPPAAPPSPMASPTLPVAEATPTHPADSRPVELSFAVADIKKALGTALGNALSQLPGAALPAENSEASLSDTIFQGGAESLVARTVGSAEGTRTAEGLRTPAYYGHKDPGNGVWNLGSFSYQHGANSPEAADQKQLARLQTQAATLQKKAATKGLSLTLEEHLNGIDLANQAPMAALDRGGYIDWLAAAKQLGMTGEEAVLWARTRSFINPDTQQWNAPGLGNNINSISRDQERRMRAIARALNAYQAQKPGTLPAAPLANLPANPALAASPAPNLPAAPAPAAAELTATQPSPEPAATTPPPEAEPTEQTVGAADLTPSFLAWFMP